MNRKKFIQYSSLFLAGINNFGIANQKQVARKSIKLERILIKKSIDHKFNWAKTNGFDSIELNSEGYNPKEILSASMDTGLKIESVYSSDCWVKSISSGRSSERKDALTSLKRAVEYAEFYGAENVQVLAGTCLTGSRSEIQRHLRGSLEEISPCLGSVKLYLQNFFGLYSEPDFYKRLFSGIELKHFGICVDNSFFGRQTDFQFFYRSLKKYICKVDIDQEGLKFLSLFPPSNENLKAISVDICVPDSAEMCKMNKSVSVTS